MIDQLEARKRAVLFGGGPMKISYSRFMKGGDQFNTFTSKHWDEKCDIHFSHELLYRKFCYNRNRDFK